MLKEIKDFYQKTKFYFNELVKLPADKEAPENWIRVFFKTYPRFPKIELPHNLDEGELKDLLYNRTSFRDFSVKPVSLESIGNLIHFSIGIKDTNKEEVQKKRFYPSAGARFPIECYLISNNISNLEKGIYHYSTKKDELETILNGDFRDNSIKIFGEDINKNNPNFLILTGVMSRTEVKYGVNAYRFASIESGHIGQNLYLLAEKEKIGCCGIGGFDNDDLSKLLDLTADEIPLYSLAIGSKLEDEKTRDSN